MVVSTIYYHFTMNTVVLPMEELLNFNLALQELEVVCKHLEELDQASKKPSKLVYFAFGLVAVFFVTKWVRPECLFGSQNYAITPSPGTQVVPFEPGEAAISVLQGVPTPGTQVWDFSIFKWILRMLEPSPFREMGSRVGLPPEGSLIYTVVDDINTVAV